MDYMEDDPGDTSSQTNTDLQNLFSNVTSLFGNGTRHELYELYRRNRRIDGIPFYCFIGAYSLLIVFGAIGNSLVVSAVIRKATMRTARNMFIINLAVSDLLLCVITMPLTLMEVLTVHWPLGRHVFLCKLVGTLQATSIFVSTISITAIALDRYHVIVYPTKPSVQRVGAVIVLGLIWLISCILAAPLFIWRNFKHFVIGLPGLSGVDFCLEEWPMDHGRAYYSIFTIIFQYAFPITVVSMAYAMICRKLRYRMKPGTQTTTDVENPTRARSGSGAGKDKNRVRKTNTLLISIALIFVISWLPLNVFNVVWDLADEIENKQTFYIIYAICHMIGMSSACSNPVLYGWLNENFRKEFRDIWSALKSCCCRYRYSRQNNNSGRVLRGSSFRSRVDREPTTVHFRKTKEITEDENDVEQSTLITQVLDRHK
ncbi:unnamed protein product [Allacma fusca]|uniref:G-protein coupled receptors family 1 profile domain-containing protein n=1 Tax=Allacma fusca TaxID=39272 RepID=A0A8J2KJB4_9HEXA|nr:unnamed protein product [Allacma fusca]